MTNFNTQQQQAIDYLDGPLLVLAGAGSGKTKVIAGKIAHLVNNIGYLPHQIAAITFTNKAAEEMTERIGNVLKNHRSRPIISTFHSLGMRIIRQEAEHLGLKKNFSIFDSSDVNKILMELYDGTGREATNHIQHQISLWKNALISPEMAVLSAKENWDKKAANIYASYNETLKSYHAVDFDDLIRLPCELFQQNKEIKYKWQMKLRYLLIDECQDTNACQYALLRHLVGNEAKFTAVGDDDQSIYAWRGADVRNIHNLNQDYPNLKIIKLEQNYRSTQRILRVANSVIANNTKVFDKKLWSNHDEGEKIGIIECKNEQDEAEIVAHKIKVHKFYNKNNFSDYAILYRGNHQAKLFEEALRSASIPYRISGGQSFFERMEIKDVLAYMRLISNTDDDQAFLRAITSPKRGIGDTTIKKLNELAQINKQSLFETISQNGALSIFPNNISGSLKLWINLINKYRDLATTEHAGNLMRDLLSEINYEQHLLDNNEGKTGEIRVKNVEDLLSWFDKKSEDNKLFEITQNITLMNVLNSKDNKENDVVHLSTLHSAKGLEYPHVFLVGCEEGIFPNENSIEENKIEEERRLMYVGITRAKKTLTITHCKKRKRANHWQFAEISRFISEMPNEDIIYHNKDSQPEQQTYDKEDINDIFKQMLKNL